MFRKRLSVGSVIIAPIELVEIKRTGGFDRLNHRLYLRLFLTIYTVIQKLEIKIKSNEDYTEYGDFMQNGCMFSFVRYSVSSRRTFCATCGFDFTRKRNFFPRIFTSVESVTAVAVDERGFTRMQFNSPKKSPRL